MKNVDKAHNPSILPVTYCRRVIGFDRMDDCMPLSRSRLNARMESNAAVYAVGSGTYQFQSILADAVK